jgi:drug/metabolite transporter (DMT)-like permease
MRLSLNSAVLAALLTTILFSISAICGHRSARLIGGTEANFWRITFASVFLAIYAYTFGQGLEGSGLPVFLASGIFGIGLGDVAFFQALPRLGPRVSMLLVHCLTAPFAALIEWLWLGTDLTGWQIAAGLMILAGVALALAPGEHLKLTRHEWTIGTVWGVLAALGGAGGAVLSRKAYEVIRANHEQIDGMNAGFQRVLGGLFIAGICLLVVKRREVQASAPKEGIVAVSKRKWRGVWFWILLNSLAGQTLGVSCMQWALETTPSGVVLPIIAMSPIVVIPMTWRTEGERPTARALVGAVIAVGGVIALALHR